MKFGTRFELEQQLEQTLGTSSEPLSEPFFRQVADPELAGLQRAGECGATLRARASAQRLPLCLGRLTTEQPAPRSGLSIAHSVQNMSFFDDI